MIRFANPEFIVILVVFIPLVIYKFLRLSRREGGSIRFSDIGVFKSIIQKTPMRDFVLLFLRSLVVILLIFAFMRPQSSSKEEEVVTEGIDIILAMDVSTSMLAEDLYKGRNRLDVSKEVASQFIDGRTNDRIGMVVFSGKSFTQCPLTLDYGILKNFLREIKIGMIEDGTAIGMAIANCINRLRDSKAKSKVVILLTDGRNNRGEINPITAANMAKAMGVRIYTIGAGKRGKAPYPVEDPFFGKRYQYIEIDIDEDVLTRIADITNGKYYRATDKLSLEKIYQEIGEMEKTKIEVKEYTRYQELFHFLLFGALILLLIEILLAQTVYRKIP